MATPTTVMVETIAALNLCILWSVEAGTRVVLVVPRLVAAPFLRSRAHLALILPPQELPLPALLSSGVGLQEEEERPSTAATEVQDLDVNAALFDQGNDQAVNPGRQHSIVGTWL